jgi:hypothetical protein
MLDWKDEGEDEVEEERYDWLAGDAGSRTLN